MDALKVKVAGEIALSSSPGATMRKWREIFGVTQSQLSKEFGVSVSTISDY
ncbi:transcriptional regulator, partial [Candidatus Micrarchaeota archaeon CG_4_10_14_0_2_um_filter_55_9]